MTDQPRPEAPLRDEVIDDLIVKYGVTEGPWPSRSVLHRFARAVAAHAMKAIKEKK